MVGRTAIPLRAWHHLILVRDGAKVRVHLDGHPEPEIAATVPQTAPADEPSVFIGGRNDGQFNFEGKLDEIALYPRPLTEDEISAHYRTFASSP